MDRVLRGWANCFCCGTLSTTRRAVDKRVYDRVRHFLRRRHKVDGRGTRQFPSDRVIGELGVLSVQRLPRLRRANAWA